MITIDVVRDVLGKDIPQITAKGYSVEEIYTCVDRYRERRDKYQIALESLAIEIPKSRIRHAVHSIRHRAKDSRHLIDKLRRCCLDEDNPHNIKEAELFELERGINDLGGIRIIHLYKHQWEEIHEYILAGCPTAGGQKQVTLKKKKAWVRPGEKHLYKHAFDKVEIKTKDNEYSSLHYVVLYSPEKCDCDNLYLEIQVRTLFEEGWGEIDHHVRYPFDATTMVKAQLQILNRTSQIANDIATALEKLHRIPVFLPWSKELDLESSADAVYCLTQTLEWASTYVRDFKKPLRQSETTYYFLIPRSPGNSILARRQRNIARALRKDLSKRVQFIPVTLPAIFFPIQSDVLLLHNISTPYGDKKQTIAVLSAPETPSLSTDERLDMVMTDAESLKRICELFKKLAPDLDVPAV